MTKETHKTCPSCGQLRLRTLFYKRTKGGIQSWCIECTRTAGARKRLQTHVHDTWYREATGNKKPLPFSIVVKYGSTWVQHRTAYIASLTLLQRLLAHGNNPQAARLLRYHRRSLPTGLPYTVTVTGEEWPLIAHALQLARKHARTDTFRKAVQNLYIKFSKARREAQLDYDIGHVQSNGAGRTGSVARARE